MRRRDLLFSAILAGFAGPLFARNPGDVPFSAALIDELARRTARSRYVPPVRTLPPALAQLDYDGYRQHRFDRSRALWSATGNRVIAEPMLRGGLFQDKVELFQVEASSARALPFDATAFGLSGVTGLGADAGFSGLRYLGPLNRADVRDELAVFQGASYFRSLARGQTYGISARGLAIGTGGPAEEFPMFRRFWLERPGADGVIRLHALLDGPSVAGAYHFRIMPGESSVIQVAARLYARGVIGAPGIAPMSSMFLLGPASARRFDDFRGAVHDSDGLEMWTGRGERLWRPLSNPARLRVSAFEDENPRGFGLMQRARSFEYFNDMEAHYERRPSLWVEPLGRWGKGSVQLIEIPTGDEFADNVAAFWRPAKPWAAGEAMSLSYRLHWGVASTAPADVARVVATRVGATRQGRQFAIDYAGALPAPADLRPRLAAQSASSVRLERLSADRMRASFEADPAGEETLRLDMEAGGRRVAETWLNRGDA